jgi:hypothetical protein
MTDNNSRTRNHPARPLPSSEVTRGRVELSGTRGSLEPEPAVLSPGRAVSPSSTSRPGLHQLDAAQLRILRCGRCPGAAPMAHAAARPTGERLGRPRYPWASVQFATRLRLPPRASITHDRKQIPPSDVRIVQPLERERIVPRGSICERVRAGQLVGSFGLLKRRGRDLNPRRTQEPETVFETAAFDRSATPPRDAQGTRRQETVMFSLMPAASCPGTVQ